MLKSNNERLWFSISLKLGKIYLDNGSYEALDAVSAFTYKLAIDYNMHS